MARCTQTGTTLNLLPPVMNLCLYEGKPDILVVTREDSDNPEVPLPLAGWSNPTAMFRTRRGGTDFIDLAPVLNGNQVDITITAAMKAAFVAFGTRTGVWEVDITDDASNLVTLVHGTIDILPEVVTV